MLSKQILIFSSFLLLIYFLWRKGRYYYLAFKIPWSSLETTLNDFWKYTKGDNKALFKILLKNIQHDGVAKCWVGHLIVNVTELEDIRKVLTSTRECVGKPNYIKVGELEHGSLLGPVEIWRAHRKILNPYFGASNVKIFFPLFKHKSETLIDNLVKYVANGEFDILHYSMMMTLDIILNTMELDLDLCSQDYETQSALRHSFEVILNSGSIRSAIYWLQFQFIYKLTKTCKVENEESKKVSNIVEQIMNNVRKTTLKKEQDKPRNFVRALMSEKNKLSEVDIRGEIQTLIFAGFDTTAIILSTTLLMLAMHKDIQNKVFTELQQIFISSESELSYEDLSELRYLDMVINESMRLFPVAPFIFRHVDKEIELGGYKVPAGADLFIPIIKVHKDVRYWGADASEFKPERFESEDFKNIHPYAFIPFTKGTRMCTGHRFANQLMKVFLANFLRRYEVETSMKMEELEFELNISMSACQGYQISLKERTQ